MHLLHCNISLSPGQSWTWLTLNSDLWWQITWTRIRNRNGICSVWKNTAHSTYWCDEWTNVLVLVRLKRTWEYEACGCHPSAVPWEWVTEAVIDSASILLPTVAAIGSKSGSHFRDIVRPHVYAANWFQPWLALDLFHYLFKGTSRRRQELVSWTSSAWPMPLYIQDTYPVYQMKD